MVHRYHQHLCSDFITLAAFTVVMNNTSLCLYHYPTMDPIENESWNLCPQKLVEIDKWKQLQYSAEKYLVTVTLHGNC
jgi:hypothetical protein